MKKTITTLFLTATAFFCLPDLGAQKITVMVPINVSESSIHWLGEKITGQHEGNINLLSGSLIIENGSLIGGDFVVDMNSIAPTDLKGESAKKLEGSLKSEEWFDVGKHAQAKLVFTSVVSQDEGLYNVTGDFTIKGKTNPATFELQVNDLEATAKVIIDRTLYNILHGSTSFFDNLKDKMINNYFEIDVSLKLLSIKTH
jgi:polyisoprenoid-binding protein YceI|tara:strand:+ start:344 stop:943 length:600 start_codon:yes stop_codon:yes gene_type:complete